MTEQALAVLKSVNYVFGTIVVENCSGIYSLEFLSNVKFAYRVIIKQNVGLFEALMPQLHSDVLVTVDESRLLCPALYPTPQLFPYTACDGPIVVFRVDATIIPRMLPQV